MNLHDILLCITAETYNTFLIYLLIQKIAILKYVSDYRLFFWQVSFT